MNVFAETRSWNKNQLFISEKKENVNMKQVQKKNRILRNEQGLTLIELLAVIVILGIISAIAVPSIGGLINKSKVETHRSNAQLIIDAARMKVMADGAGGTTTIPIETLVTDGYLDTVPEDPDNKGGFYLTTTQHSSNVLATKDPDTGKFTYSITLYGNKDGGAVVTYLYNVAESALNNAKIPTPVSN